jgi:peptidoglycan/xylan/chitin deacetylase (PgdA/CDA1 family)
MLLSSGILIFIRGAQMGGCERRWPDNYGAAVSITMDNMGEAAEILRGTWPDDQPPGNHASVTTSLPRMRSILDQFNVRATYFVEGWNTGYYPDALHSLSDTGHEVAFHGWQHEMWSTLEPDVERELFARSLEGFDRLGLTISGFRPPGGVLTDSTSVLMREFGLTYTSPAGAAAALDGGVVYVPFDWQGIDAYFYAPGFAGLRDQKGDQDEPLTPSAFVERATALIDERARAGGYTALLFHPFLEMDEARLDAMRAILEHVRRNDVIWCAPCREIADWIRTNPEGFGSDPGLDLTSWSR